MLRQLGTVKATDDLCQTAGRLSHAHPNQQPRGYEPPPLRYAGGSMTELSDCTDDVLDHALLMFFRQHAEATEAGDTQGRAECHWSVMQILEEQSRRLDNWIAEHTEVTA